MNTDYKNSNHDENNSSSNNNSKKNTSSNNNNYITSVPFSSGRSGEWWRIWCRLNTNRGLLFNETKFSNYLRFTPKTHQWWEVWCHWRRLPRMSLATWQQPPGQDTPQQRSQRKQQKLTLNSHVSRIRVRRSSEATLGRLHADMN